MHIQIRVFYNKIQLKLNVWWRIDIFVEERLLIEKKIQSEKKNKSNIVFQYIKSALLNEGEQIRENVSNSMDSIEILWI
jgi:hypothetical protein